MTLVIRNSECPLTSATLKDVEDRLGFELPDDYRNFLLKHNGGQPQPSVFHFKYESGRYADSCIDWFLAVYHGEHDNFETYYEMYKGERMRLPPELVPIAHDPGGNLICISVIGFRKGAVFFWDHEKEVGDGESPSYKNIHLIADSFAAFIAKVTEKP